MNPTTKSTHTAGPWSFASINKHPSLCLRIWSGNIEVAQINHWGKPEKDLTCDPKPSGEAEANARLIAAAPDLLAALQRVKEIIASGEDLSNAAFFGTEHAQIDSALAAATK